MTALTDCDSNLFKPKTSIEVLVLRDHCENAYLDFYLADIMVALRLNGYEIKVCSMDEKSITSNIKDPENKIQYHRICPFWVPNSIFGYLKVLCQRLQMLERAYRVTKTFNPKIILTDVEPLQIPLLKFFSNARIMMIPDLRKILSKPILRDDMTYQASRITAFCYKFVDDVILQTTELRLLCRNAFVDPLIPCKVVVPCYETLSKIEGTIDLKKLVRNLFPCQHLFVAFINFNEDSNINLLLKTWDIIHTKFDAKYGIKLHLVVTSYKNWEASSRGYYKSLVKFCRHKIYKSYITFIFETTPLEQRELVNRCTAVIQPTKHDVFPEPIFLTMSLGKPLICLNTRLSQEYIKDNLNGFIIEEDPVQLANLIHKFQTNEIKVKALLKSTFECFKKYNFDHLGASYCLLLKKFQA